ncbi:MAG: helix-turn-helix domain-containing protein [Lachnospiraceae bacterium]|jgi:AcrR family transcriptional regulator|nr:helix-turn-helix domain-containing protein [Lachnospiraceae bacterium]
MARKTQISKEVILEAALEMLIRDGYSAINIKTLSKEIGCSTQPLVWHFENMDGLREALAEYALNYANDKMRSNANGMDAFTNVGMSYIEIAFEQPRLFSYLFMSGDSGFIAGNLDVFTTADENGLMVEQIALQLKISIEKASVFYRDMMIYTHGLASFIASGLIKTTKEEAKQMINHLSEELLLQAGVSDISTK